MAVTQAFLSLSSGGCKSKAEGPQSQRLEGPPGSQMASPAASSQGGERGRSLGPATRLRPHDLGTAS